MLKRRRTVHFMAVSGLLLGTFGVGPIGEALAQQRPAVVVTPGSARTFRAAVQIFADRSEIPEPNRVQVFHANVESALEFSGVFKLVSHRAFLGPVTSASLDHGPPMVCSDWSQIGADAFVEGELIRGRELSIEFRVWDTARCVRLTRKRYKQPLTADQGFLARRVADDIVASFIGMRGVASTEIAYVSTRDGNTEIYVMSADGSRQRRATRNGSINNFPDWAPNGEGILYTSYRHQNRPLLFLSSRGRNRPGRLLKKLGGKRSEYRGVFSPSGSRIALVMSNLGQGPEIYTVRADGRSLKRLTRSRAIEIAPAWSPDEKRIAFVSDRSGSPQVYVMNVDGSNQKRLTFQGSYNTHPAWSPDGRWIAYESRIGGQFDIWLIDPDGELNFPLIEHPRSDESPAWAPNSRKLAFSSGRRGRADIYVVDVNGENVRRLTRGSGENTSPSWGPFPR